LKNSETSFQGLPFYRLLALWKKTNGSQEKKKIERKKKRSEEKKPAVPDA
jgi:hypothetical protein